MKSQRPKTTLWGFGLAAAIIYVAMALSQPHGSTSLVGRSVGWLIAQLPTKPTVDSAPAQVATGPVGPATPKAPPAPPPAPAPLAEASPSPALKPVVVEPPIDLAAGELPPLKALKPEATNARLKMSHAPSGIQFRAVYATIVAGAFNGDKPGEPYIGFCGEMNVAADGWGRTGWKPFFVSNTRAAVRGQTAYLNVANPLGVEKCTGKMSSDDFAAIFNAGPTDKPAIID